MGEQEGREGHKPASFFRMTESYFGLHKQSNPDGNFV